MCAVYIDWYMYCLIVFLCIYRSVGTNRPPNSNHLHSTCRSSPPQPPPAKMPSASIYKVGLISHCCALPFHHTEITDFKMNNQHKTNWTSFTHLYQPFQFPFLQWVALLIQNQSEGNSQAMLGPEPITRVRVRVTECFITHHWDLYKTSNAHHFRGAGYWLTLYLGLRTWSHL